MASFITGRQQLAETAQEFSAQLSNFASQFEDQFELIVETAVKKLFNTIILRSPVDTGAYRGSHNIANGTVPSGGTFEGGSSEAEDPSYDREANSGAATQKARNNIRNWHWKLSSGVIWIYNNQPYAEVLEFGGYPKNPVMGSYVRSLNKYVIKSQGGYSKQAPKGIYIISIQEFMKHLEEAVKEVLG